jgi:hypothetical protein
MKIVTIVVVKGKLVERMLDLALGWLPFILIVVGYLKGKGDLKGKRNVYFVYGEVCVGKKRKEMSKTRL